MSGSAAPSIRLQPSTAVKPSPYGTAGGLRRVVAEHPVSSPAPSVSGASARAASPQLVARIGPVSNGVQAATVSGSPPPAATSGALTLSAAGSASIAGSAVGSAVAEDLNYSIRSVNRGLSVPSSASQPLGRGGGKESNLRSSQQAASASVAAPPAAAATSMAADRESRMRPFRSPPPFYWVQSVETIAEFEVGGAFGEVVTKLGDFKDENSALPIAGTLRMAKGGLYTWSIQVVKQCPHRPHLLFGIHGAAHARPWRLISTGRCSRSRDDGPWLSRPGGDLVVRPGDYVHCEADLRGLDGHLGSFAFAVNAGAFETAFEDIPLDGPLHPVLCMGGGGSVCRLCDG